MKISLGKLKLLIKEALHGTNLSDAIKDGFVCNDCAKSPYLSPTMEIGSSEPFSTDRCAACSRAMDADKNPTPWPTRTSLEDNDGDCQNCGGECVGGVCNDCGARCQHDGGTYYPDEEG